MCSAPIYKDEMRCSIRCFGLFLGLSAACLSSCAEAQQRYYDNAPQYQQQQQPAQQQDNGGYQQQGGDYQQQQGSGNYQQQPQQGGYQQPQQGYYDQPQAGDSVPVTNPYNTDNDETYVPYNYYYY